MSNRAASAFKRCFPILSPNDRRALLLLGGLVLGGGLLASALQPPLQLGPAPLDLNQAKLKDLTALPGLGPVLARRIIVYRQTHGPFPKLEALTRVRGVGPALLERLRPYLTVGPPPGGTP